MKRPQFERFAVPLDIVDLAKRRTAFLFRIASTMRTENVLANAYLQGMADAADVIASKETAR